MRLFVVIAPGMSDPGPIEVVIDVDDEKDAFGSARHLMQFGVVSNTNPRLIYPPHRIDSITIEE